MFGALSGLLLIYTVDLPQIQDLPERYLAQYHNLAV